MLVHASELLENLSQECGDPASLLTDMVRDKKVIRLKRDLYETDPATPAYLVANEMHDPSYISFDYALARHGVLHGGCVVVTSATFGLSGGDLTFSTPLGMLSYANIPRKAYPIGIETHRHHGREYRMATKEKAVCDKLSRMDPVRSLDGIIDMMFVELGFDEDAIFDMDVDLVSEMAGLYRSSTVSTMARYLGAKPRREEPTMLLYRY